ncbi:hypothetical protein F3Y22_tig00110646pilonHSYRG00072 [Hibiscus syriacus]|uniref:Uncharacterized protein n=1 Tax=Hibiscus syriacus TaxID=106335 RepID=A0A6A2ZXQ1_HIBSY|nr:hypothetical protein F3Y22_tig00110646pilonHSYRG00072 [Hibiscus syriacus]
MALNKKYEVESIPCLVILQLEDTMGDATFCDGVELVYRNGVDAFPFTKEKLKELRREEKRKHDSQTVSFDSLIEDQAILERKNGEDFEIIFVSNDHDQNSFGSFFGPDGKTVTKQGRNLINLYQETAYPFTDVEVESMEKEMEEEAMSLPRREYRVCQLHELTLCLECGYEVHPRCISAVTPQSSIEDS